MKTINALRLSFSMFFVGAVCAFYVEHQFDGPEVRQKIRTERAKMEPPLEESVEISKPLILSATSSTFQEKWERQLKTFENDVLLCGAQKNSNVRTDTLSKKKVKEVGYGITPDEVKAAKAYGFLPKNTTLPSSLSKAEADRWFEQVTLPTYTKCVEGIVGKRKLSAEQKFALISFCHNLGTDPLRKILKCKPENVAEAMKKYVYADHKIRPGLVKRRAWEASLWEEGLEKSKSLLAVK